MSSINIRKLSEEAAGFTQANFIRSRKKNLTVGEAVAPQVFTSTFMASASGDYLFELGTGSIDAVNLTRMMLQYAADKEMDMTSVADEFLQVLMKLSYSPESFRKIIAGILGSGDKAIGKNRIPVVTPTFVLSLVRKEIPEADELMVHMVSDYVCHMLNPLGWISADNSYTYRMKRTASYPTYDSLIDIMSALQVMKVLNGLAEADLKLIYDQAKKNNAISPAQIAHHMSSAMVTAHQRTRGKYDSEAIVRSVLTTMGRVWSPHTPEALQPSPRVVATSAVNDLRANLSIFLAYQDMVGRKALKPEVFYGDEEMQTQVLPFFMEAMATVSPYSRRLMSDVVSFMGKSTSADHMGQPNHVILYEDWDFATELSAFVPVKQTAKGDQRFLDVQQHISGALAGALRPIRTAVNVRRMVDERIATYDMVPNNKKGLPGQASLTLGFPSLLEREVFHRLDSGMIEKAMLAGKIDDEALDASSLSRDVFERMHFDYVAQLTHLAVARSHDVSVSADKPEKGSASVEKLFLIFDLQTTLKVPVGKTAIHLGRVMTTEPLEALAYVADFNPTTALQVEEIPLEKHRESVHLWPWFAASDKLSFETTYSTSLRNKGYTVLVDEHELLGLGRRRDNVFFLRPLVAAAIVRMWMTWHTEDRAFVDKQAKSTKDELVTAAFEGKKVRNAMHMASMLASIGSEGTGSNASRFAEQRIVDQMYDSGNVDDYSELHVGVQKHRLNIWAGLTSMQLLGLLTRADAEEVLDYLRETNALSLIVGSSHYSA